ncbi:hypothetical protein WSK_1730 [Novosphingobium sp. Rr 2-17]|nr:hypothetical protein WSK_1730 [Novosphingobium sp. Rr 2-17]
MTISDIILIYGDDARAQTTARAMATPEPASGRGGPFIGQTRSSISAMPWPTPIHMNAIA